MNKFIVTAALLLAAASANAATTISTTLTLTSPTAIISMTGVGAVASLTTIYTRSISATQLGLSGVSITTWPYSRCFTSNDISITGSYNLSAFAHGLGAVPNNWQVWMRNTIANLGYTAGEVVDIGGTNSASNGFNLAQNSTSTTVVFGVAPAILNKTNGSITAITPADWVLVVKECI